LKRLTWGLSQGGYPNSGAASFTDENGTVIKAIIGTYGDTVHTLVDRKNYKGIFMPGYHQVDHMIPYEEAGLIGVDHVVGNVEQMEEWVSYYENVMGFTHNLKFKVDAAKTLETRLKRNV
jgi:4-hydroxyphenylpyruvate dioxygenase